jgi:hypothetical protein
MIIENHREREKEYPEEDKMKELKKKIEEEIFGLPEGIVKTDNGDLLVNKIGTKFVHVYNLHKQKNEKYTIKDFAFFALGKNWKVSVFEELLIESKNYYLYSKYEDNKNVIANRALHEANKNYGLNGADIEDSLAWEKARDLVL